MDNLHDLTKPVAWIWEYANGEEEVVFVPPRHVDATHVDAPSTITPLYTSPPQRTWQRLTDVERAQIVLLNKKLTWLEQLDVFEAKLKEKNT